MGSESTPEGSPAKTQRQPDDLESSNAKRPRREVDAAGEASHSKARVRVTRACDECRRRKDRCDAQRPSCKPCLVAGRTCAYNPSKKRGLRTGYVRSLEILFGVFLGSIDGMETLMSGLLDGEVTRATLNNFRLMALPNKTEDVAEFAPNLWRKSNVVKKLESLLAVTENHDDEDDSTDTFEGRLSQALTGMANLQQEQQVQAAELPSRLPISPMDTEDTSTILTQVPPPSSDALTIQNTQPTYPAPEPCYLDDLDVSSQTPPKDLPDTDQLSVPPNWSYLLDLHFSKTHCWFPISHKHDLLRSAYTLANSNQSTDITTLSQRGDAAFFWATLAYSSHHNDVMAIASGQEPSDRGLTQNLRDTAKRLSNPETGEYEIGHMRALLILALFEVTTGCSKLAWHTIGRAVYVAGSLKLLGYPGDVHRPLDEGTKRALLGCMVLETLLASRIHARPYFRRSDIERVGPLQTEGIEEWEPWQPRLLDVSRMSQGSASRHAPGRVLSIFSKFVDMIGHLNDVLIESESGMGQPSQHDIGNILEQLQPTLPQKDGDISDEETSPQALNLQLAVHCIDYFRSSRQSSSSNSQSVQSTAGRLKRMSELSGSLKRQIQRPEAIWMPPTIPIYLFLSQDSLGSEGLLQSSAFREERQLFLNSLLDAETAWWKGLATDESLQQAANHARQISNQGRQEAPLHPTSHLPHRPDSESFFQSLVLPNVGDSYLRRLEIGNTQVGEESARSELVDATPLPSAQTLNQQIEANTFNPLVGRIGEIGDEELFDTLAILDSTDWVANPPEFMRNLGDLGDSPMDINSFLDPDLI